MQQGWRLRGQQKFHTISGSGLRIKLDNIFNPIHLPHHIFLFDHVHTKISTPKLTLSFTSLGRDRWLQFLYDENHIMFTLMPSKSLKLRIRVTRIYEPNPIKRNIPLFRPSPPIFFRKIPLPPSNQENVPFAAAPDKYSPFPEAY